LAEVSDIFRSRWWRNRFVGEAKPNFVVGVRKGRFKRAYGTWLDPETGEPEQYGNFRGGAGYNNPWQATWVPGYLDEDLPGLYDPDDPDNGYSYIESVEDFDCTQDFDQNGIANATIIAANTRLKSQEGVSGLYHAFERGFLSPWRGERRGAGGTDRRQPKTEWYGVLAYDAQITVWAGFGDALVKVFTGLVDDVDSTSTPDKVTISTRDFGQVLVDERVWKNNKDPILWMPLTFADRRGADEVTEVGSNGPGDSSSNLAGHTPRMVIDDSTDTWWASEDRGDADKTEWVQIKVTQGRYESVKIDPKYAGMECYISIKAQGDSTLDGAPLEPGEWVDVGKGDVPGDNGGHPYIKRIGNLVQEERSHALGGVYRLDYDSVIRISFRNLNRIRDGVYRAGVVRFIGERREVLDEAQEDHTQWIRVDDISDVVKIILRWAGFKEWRVEMSGARIDGKSVFTAQNYYMDLIKQLAEFTGFVFYIDQPTDDDLSIGVPVFERNHAVRAADSVEQVRDDHLLTGVQVKLSDAPLASVIRVKGQVATKKEGGIPTMGTEVRRYHYVYVPPWTRHRRLAGIVKHTNHLDNKFTSKEHCQIAALHIALAQALASATAVIEIPPNPAIMLDGHVFLLDVSTGMNTRLYISNRSMKWTRGEHTDAKMSLGGSLIDLPDIVGVIEELQAIGQAS
jgi:hypothetical protein